MLGYRVHRSRYLEGRYNMFACNNSKLIYENVIVLQNVYQQVMTKASGVYLHLKEKA